jgi:glutathione S-transferase
MERPTDLYISPLSGSFPAHLACLEVDLAVRVQRVDRKTKLLDDGRDYRSIAPKGAVPALSLEDGSVLTESAAVLQYIADLVPDANLAPAWGTPARYRLIEWINFVSTELHKKHLSVLFSSRAPAPVTEWALSGAAASFAHPARHLETQPYLLGHTFTVADCYLFWAVLVAPYGGISLEPWPSLRAYVERIQQRPSVTRALSLEMPLYRAETAAGTAPPLRPVAPPA